MLRWRMRTRYRKFARDFAVGLGLAAAVPASLVVYGLAVFFGIAMAFPGVETFHHPIVDGSGLDRLTETDRVVLNNAYGADQVHFDVTEPELIDLFVRAIQDPRRRGGREWPAEWDAAEEPSLLRNAAPHRFSCRFHVRGELRKAWNFCVPSPRTLRWTFRSSLEHDEIPDGRSYVFTGPLTPRQSAFLRRLHAFGQPPGRVVSGSLNF